jgi:uncharacterized protein YfaQ (DUF2300 family)
MRWVSHAACMGAIRNVLDYNILVQNHEQERPRNCNNNSNIEMYCKYMRLEKDSCG